MKASASHIQPASGNPVKAKLKRMLGHRNVQRIQALKGQLKYAGTWKIRKYAPLSLDSHWKVVACLHKPGKHLFFGYYDLQQLDGEGKRLLVTELPRRADTAKTPALLQWVDMDTQQYHTIAQTQAWCFQQGARLRWHPQEKNWVLFNAAEKGSYVAKVYDIQENREVATYPRALYDITPDGTLGLTLNFARLQRLRPGYGYRAFPDETAGQKVPEGDGIFAVDLQTGGVRCIISLRRLVTLTPEAEGCWNYVNHISISPHGKRFLFFHLWTTGGTDRWRNKLYIAGLDGTGLTCLEGEVVTSHYCWRDDDTLLTTTAGFGGRSEYRLYDLSTGSFTRLTSPELTKDGHPVFCRDGLHFLLDTYPQRDGMQHLLLASAEGKDCQAVCSVYADPRLLGERRCDLHPRLTPDNQYITIDTSFRGGTRSVLVLKHTG